MNRAALTAATLRLCARLPLPLLHALGTAAGWLLWLVPNRERRTAATNLRICLPELSPRTRRRLLRRSLAEAGKTLLELGPLWLWPGERVLARIRSVDNEVGWQAALAAGQGAIAITPHLGAWEVAGLYLSSRCRLTTLYRPSRLGPEVDALICHGRARLGARLVATDRQGVRELFQALRAGEALGILPDQDPGVEGGRFAPFFGQPANTMVLLSRLAARCRAPVWLLYAERLPRGRGYRLRFDPLPAIVAEGPLDESLAALNAAIETAVRRRPDQYLWSYRRFKRRPPGWPALY
ncbi:MAG: lysophospholipid acyltransferase family protein [Candidatus Competibacterales bacterium]|nr:lysophospholipid acyltransferase family protein [Candidatus Competibacterales bacterium]